MRRIAFLRSIEIQQTAPYLDPLAAVFEEHGIRARLFYTDGECEPADFPGSSEKLNPAASVNDIVARLLDCQLDGAVSLSIPDECSLRDAMIREKLASRGIPMVMHNASATVRLANKWTTKELVRAAGLNTPGGMLLDGDLLNGRNLLVPAYGDLVQRRAEELGYPLLIKPLWGCLGNGIRYLADPADLTDYLHSPYDGHVVLERCLAGELCSAEVVGRDGRYVVQPLIWKGRTGGAPTFAFDQLRYSAPRRAADAGFAPVVGRIQDLCAELDLTGAIEVEMIYAEGRYQVIEINPRVSGSTTMSIAASGLNTYECLLRMLLGSWSPPGTGQLAADRRFALQFPTAPLDGAAARAVRKHLNVVRASSFHIDGKSYPNMVITCTLTELDWLAAAIESLSARHRFVRPSVLADIQAQIATTVEETRTAAA